MNFTEALFLTMPGFTGFLLVVVLAGLFLTSLQKFRTEPWVDRRPSTVENDEVISGSVVVAAQDGSKRVSLELF